MGTPYYTSDDIIEAVKRKISFPTSQNTFSDNDILAFANEEMAISQVPSVLQFHQEYFVYTQTIPILNGVANYPIPERAIGQKLRAIFYVDQNGNLSDMTKIKSEDRAFFQSNIGSNQVIYKYYLEGNNIVLTPTNLANPVGSLQFVYFLRPNQLVSNDQAAISTAFCNQIQVVNSSVNSGDTITLAPGQTEQFNFNVNNLYNVSAVQPPVVFTAVSGAPGPLQFQIGGSSVITALNLVNAINANGIVSASSSSPSTDTVTITYQALPSVTVTNIIGIPTVVTIPTATTSNTNGFVIPNKQGVIFNSIPSIISNLDIVDFLQTKAGHKTLALSIKIPANSVSGNTIYFNQTDVPYNMQVGDYICLENQCIIPQIPSDLHNGLAEKTSARILAAIGDQAGLQISNQKIQDISKAEGALLDNRTEANPIKVTARHSLLRYGKMGTRRRM